MLDSTRGELRAIRSGKIMLLRWKDKRDVWMITTKHKNDTVEVQRRGEQNPITKPRCIVDYNQFMNGVDRSDQKLSYYPFKRKTLKWYKKLFYRLLYLTFINSHIRWSAKQDQRNKRQISLYNFLKQLSLELSQNAVADEPNHRQRSSTVARLSEKHFITHIPSTNSKTNPTRRCVVCSAKGVRRESRFYCDGCDKALCLEECFKAYHTKKEFSQ